MPITIVQKRNVVRFLELQKGNYIFPAKQEAIIQFDAQFNPRNIVNDLTAVQKAELKKIDNTKRKQIERAGGRANVQIIAQPRGQIVRNANLQNPLLHVPVEVQPVRRIRVQNNPNYLNQVGDVFEPVHRVRENQFINIDNNRPTTLPEAVNVNFLRRRIQVPDLNKLISKIQQVTTYLRKTNKQKEFRMIFCDPELDNRTMASTKLLITASTNNAIKDEIERVHALYLASYEEHYGYLNLDEEELERRFLGKVLITMQNANGGCNKHKSGERQLTINTNEKINVYCPSSRDENCGLELIRYLHPDIPTCHSLRKEFGLKSKQGTDAPSLNEIAEKYKFAITFTNTTGINLITAEPITWNEPIIFILKENHWFLFKNKIVRGPQLKRPRREGVKARPWTYKNDEKPVVWVKFDLETRNNIDFPHKVGNATYFPQISTLCSYSYSTDIYDKNPITKHYLSMNCIKQFIDDLLELTANGQRCIIHSHNGSRFDMFFIFDYLLKTYPNEDIPNSSLIRGSKIMSIVFQEGRLVFLDSMNVLTGSLDRLCKDYQVVDGKKSNYIINGNEVKSLELCQRYPELTPSQFIEKLNQPEEELYKDAYVDYCNYDTISLFQLHGVFVSTINGLVDKLKTNFKEEIQELIAKVDISQSTTLSGFSDKLFQSIHHFKGKEGKMVPYLWHPTGEVADFVNKSKCGGISEVFQAGIHEGNVACLDVVSLYVSVMINAMYPKGAPIKTDVYVKGFLGIYRVENINQKTEVIMDYPATVKGSRDWKEKHIDEAHLTNIDIDRMLQHGSTMNIKEGYYWKESCRPFKQMLSVFTDEKMRQDELKGTPMFNNALREACKLMGNSLFGRQLMTIEPTIYNQIKCISDISLDLPNVNIILTQTGMMVQSKGQEKNGCIQFGTFILAHSRHLMQTYFDVVGRQNVIASETDSIYLPLHALPKAEKYIGKKYGMLDYEFKNCEQALFVGKKQYAIIKPDGKNDKLKCKGMGASHLSKEVYENIIYKGTHTTEAKIVQFQRNLFNLDFTGISISSNVQKTLTRDKRLTYNRYFHTDYESVVLDINTDVNDHLIKMLGESLKDMFINTCTEIQS